MQLEIKGGIKGAVTIWIQISSVNTQPLLCKFKTKCPDWASQLYSSQSATESVHAYAEEKEKRRVGEILVSL